MLKRAGVAALMAVAFYVVAVSAGLNAATSMPLCAAAAIGVVVLVSAMRGRKRSSS